MTNRYFVPLKQEKIKGGVRFHGQVLVDAVLEMEEPEDPPTGGGGGGGGDKPPKPKYKIEIPDLFYELKWIAWPGSPSEAFGQAAGYETVSPDDVNYPPPRK